MTETYKLYFCQDVFDDKKVPGNEKHDWLHDIIDNVLFCFRSPLIRLWYLKSLPLHLQNNVTSDNVGETFEQRRQ